MKPSVDEPIELRTVHPAPPASTKVHGKTYTSKRLRIPIVSTSREVRSGLSNKLIVEREWAAYWLPMQTPGTRRRKDI